jgi:hypothetical protein
MRAMSADPLPRMDKTKFSVGRMDDGDGELEYWITKTPEERFEALEFMRRVMYGYTSDAARLRRVLEVATREGC